MAGEVAERNWWQRNWKWFVPTIVVVGVGAIVGFVLLIFSFVMTLMKSSEPFRHGLAEARENPAITAALGEPIQEGSMISGNFQESGPTGSASLAIPLSGPKGDATLYVEAHKSAGQWQYQTLVVELKASGQRIDLEK
jgi:hypothetical protein